MKLLRLVLVLALALTACNQTDTTKNQIKDHNTNTTNVSNETNRGQAIGKEYGGKGTGYGQVKKFEPGQATPPITVAPQTLLQKVDAYSMKHLQVHTTSVELIKSDSNGVGIEYKIVFDNWNRGWDLRNWAHGLKDIFSYEVRQFTNFPSQWGTGGYMIVELDVPPVLDAVEQKIKQILESQRMTITYVENATMVAEFDPNTHQQIGWVHNIYINGMGYLSTEEQSVITTEIEQATGYDIVKFIKSSDSILIYCNNEDGERVTPL